MARYIAPILRCFLALLPALALVIVASSTFPAGAGATSPARTATIPPAYIVTDLGTLGGNFSQANSINNAGQITGMSNLSTGTYHAFLYSNGTMTDIDIANSPSSNGYGINANGVVVGAALLTNDYHAFRYANGAMDDLGTLGGRRSLAIAINDLGQIVGQSSLEERGPHAFLYDNGTMTDLGGVWADSTAFAINNSGQIVGYGFFLPPTEDYRHHAFLSYNGSMTDLGTLGDESWSSSAYGINDAGQIVGASKYADDGGYYHAFLYQHGTMTDLGTLGGLTSSAQAINNAGLIVGGSWIEGAEELRAVIWDSGTVIDLNTLIPADSGWTLAVANDINDAGQIVGFGTHNGQQHAFLLDPVAACVIDDSAASATTVRAMATRTVSGQVFWSESAAPDVAGMPVQGAKVRIGCHTTTTDASGSYTLTIDPTTDVGDGLGEVRLKIFQHATGAAAEAAERFNVRDRDTQQPIGNFGDHVELSVNADHVALQNLTVEHARFDQEGFTIQGASLKLFPAPNDAPLTVDISYKKATDELKIHASSGTYRWGSQSVQLTSADYQSPADTLSVAGKVNLAFGDVTFQNLNIAGERTANTLDLHASGTATNVYGADFTFTEVSLVQAGGETTFRMRGSVALPNQKNAATFDTTVQDGTTTFDLALQDFDFYKTPVTAHLRYRSASGVSELAVTGQAPIVIGGASILVSIDAVITPNDPIVKASADFDLGQQGVATVALRYDGKQQSLTGTGTLIWNVEPCDQGYFGTAGNLPKGFPAGPSVQKIELTVTLANGQLTVTGHADLKVPCELRGRFGDFASLDIGYTNEVASVQVSIPVKINNTTIGAFFRLEAGNGEGKVFLGVSIPFGGAVGGGAHLRESGSHALVEPQVRVLITDPLGGKIGHEPATGQFVNTIPGATYNGVVDGVDSFTLPAFLGGYIATLSATADTSVTITVGETTFTRTLSANVPDSFGVAMAPAAGGDVAVDGVATLTLTTHGAGTVAATPAPPTYALGGTVTVTAQSANSAAFLGWTIDGTPAGTAKSLTLAMENNHTVVANFTVPTFSDVHEGDDAYEAITALASRGIILGYANGKFGPEDEVERAQMAAFIVRALEWQQRPTGPRSFRDFDGLVAELRVASLILANACDAENKCVARGYDSQHFGPTDDVTYAQVISLIVRAFSLDPNFAWAARTDTAHGYSGVPAVHDDDLRTFTYYVGAITTIPENWNGSASRAWVAQVLYQALQSAR